MRWSVTHTHVSIPILTLIQTQPFFQASRPHLVIYLGPVAAGGAAQVDQVTVAVHLAQTPGEDGAHDDDGGVVLFFFVFLLTFTLF